MTIRRQRHGGDQFNLGVFFVAQSPLAVRHQADGVRAVAISGVVAKVQANLTHQSKCTSDWNCQDDDGHDVQFRKLMAGSVGAAVALTGPEGHLRRKIQIAQLGEPFTKSG
jgi:hypothetical protein